MYIDDIPFVFIEERFERSIRSPTVTEVEKYASNLGIRFPDEYVYLIVKYAGNIIPSRVGCLTFESSLNGEEYAFLGELGILFHFDFERDSKYSVQIRHNEISKKYGTSHVVPICTSGVNEYSEIAFDFRNSRIHPTIIELDYESEVMDKYGNPIPTYIANSFQDFIDKLMTEEEFEAKYGSMVI